MSSTVTQTKFKADPYNFSNHLVTSQDDSYFTKLNMKLQPSKIFINKLLLYVL